MMVQNKCRHISFTAQCGLTVLSKNPYNPADSRFKHPVTRHKRARRRKIEMLRLVSLQLMATVVAGAIAALLGGWAAMVSAVLGGACCVIPNALFALRLFTAAKKPGGANPATFFIGEFIKIALTLAGLGLVVWLYRDLNWLALIAGFIVALKSYIILLFRH
jgi:ATP synthase protein I